MSDDDEIKQLLREIRDIALRNESAARKEAAFRKRIWIVWLVAVAIAFGGLAYLMHFLNSTTVVIEEHQTTAVTA